MAKPQQLSATVSAVPKIIANKTGAIVDDWISVQAWYMMIAVIGLRPGGWLQRIARHDWDASR